MMGIYAITHIESNRCYVGSGVDVKRRIRDHRSRLNAGKHQNAHLQNAWNKYGRDAFTFTILEEVFDQAQLVERERWWIRELGATFNMMLPGDDRRFYASEETRRKIGAASRGRVPSAETREKLKAARAKRVITAENLRKMHDARRNGKVSEATRQKLREAHRGRPHSPEQIQKMVDSRRGRPLTEEHRRAISEAKRGHITSEETKCKISAALKGKPLSAETRRKMREAHRKRKKT